MVTKHEEDRTPEKAIEKAPIEKAPIAKEHVVEIGRMQHSDEHFIARGCRWSTNDIIKMAEGLTPFPVPLASISLQGDPWNMYSFDDFLYHVKRMNAADDSYPIIYDYYGVLCNGWHRVAKAILAGKTHIMAVRLESMPEGHTIKKGK